MLGTEAGQVSTGLVTLGVIWRCEVGMLRPGALCLALARRWDTHGIFSGPHQSVLHNEADELSRRSDLSTSSHVLHSFSLLPGGLWMKISILPQSIKPGLAPTDLWCPYTSASLPSVLQPQGLCPLLFA